MPTELDRETFSDRLARLYAHWQVSQLYSHTLLSVYILGLNRKISKKMATWMLFVS